MATKEYIFTGKGAWVSKNAQTFANGDTVWGLALYPRTAADRKEIKATGIKNREMIDDGKGIEEGLVYFRLRNKTGPYKIVDPQGNEVEALVGNGSEIAVKLAVETFNSPKFGPQARSTVTEVVVMKLIPYAPKDIEPVAVETPDLPV